MADDGVRVLRGARRTAIVAIIASLVIAAILGIVALLSGEMGELQSKVLLTTLAVAGFGTTALCHLAVVARAVRVVGWLGILASAAAATAALVLIWRDWSVPYDLDPVNKTLIVATIAAVSLAQANLLLLLAGRPHPVIRVALGVTLLAIATVAVMVAIPALTDGEIPAEPYAEGYFRGLGVAAILDALGTIALPILGLILRRAAAEAPVVAPAEAGVRLALELPSELADRLAAAAGRTGSTREEAALAALERGLPGD